MVLLQADLPAEASALTPSNGYFIYVTDTNLTFTSVGFWGYESGSWVKK